jgi:hypothetical protein
LFVFSPQSNGTHFIYQNYIQGEVEPHGGAMGVISRARHLNLRFCCEYPLYQSLSMTMDLNPLERSEHPLKQPIMTGIKLILALKFSSSLLFHLK